MLLALYFRSKKNFMDISTWDEEYFPQDYSYQEIEKVAKLAKYEGYVIIDTKANHQIKKFKWFK